MFASLELIMTTARLAKTPAGSNGEMGREATLIALRFPMLTLLLKKGLCSPGRSTHMRGRGRGRTLTLPPSKDRDPRIYEAQQPPNDNASIGSDSVTAVLAGRCDWR